MYSIARTSQPRSRIGLKAGHPAFINNAPLFAYNAAGGLVDIQNHAMTSVGALSFADNFGGYASKSTGASIRIDLNRNISPATRNCTVIAIFVVRSLAQTARILQTHSNAANYAGIWLNANTTGTLEIASGSNAGTTAAHRRSLTTPAGSIVVDTLYCTVMGFLSATTGFGYLNGVDQTLTASGTAASYGAGTGVGKLHASLNAGTLAYGDQEICGLIVLPNTIDLSLARSISINPWQLFEDYHRPMMLDAATSDPIGPLIYSKLTHGLVNHGARI